MNKKRLVIAIVAVCLSLVLLVPFGIACSGPTVTPTPTPTPVTYNPRLIFAAGTSAGSSDYVAYAKLVELGTELNPDVIATMILAGGGLAAANSFLLKEADFAVLASSQLPQIIEGEGAWEGKPYPNTIRVLHAHKSTLSPIAVWEDSDIYTVSDLVGRRVFMGYSGTMIYAQTRDAFEAIGLNVIDSPGSLADGIAMMKDGRIDAFTKSVPGYTYDASHIEIMGMGKSLRFIGYTEEEIAQIKAVHPYGYRLLPEDWFVDHPQPAVWVNEILGLVVTHADLPEEWAYLWTKGNIEGLDELVEIYPAAGLTTPLEDTIRILEPLAQWEIYMHPGAIRAFREYGVEVPASVVPPGMK